MDESDFLIHTTQLLGNKVGGFWIGLYRNVDGNILFSIIYLQGNLFLSMVPFYEVCFQKHELTMDDA